MSEERYDRGGLIPGPPVKIDLELGERVWCSDGRVFVRTVNGLERRPEEEPNWVVRAELKALLAAAAPAPTEEEPDA
jgi:hypothetical protein